MPPVSRRFGEPQWYADDNLLALACAADGSLWSVEEPGVLQHWAVNGMLVGRFELSDLETLWVFDPEARWVASGADDLVIYDVATQAVVKSFEQPSWITAIAFHPKKKWVATGHDDGVVRLWNFETDDEPVELAHHDQAISALAYTTDGELLAAACEDRTISLWKSGEEKPQRVLKGHSDRIPALAWKPGTRLLVSAGWDTTARLWNIDTGEPILLLNSHADQVYALAFSPDGELLAVADSAATIHIWNDISTGKVLHVLPGDHDEVRALTFTRDGKHLLVGGSDRVIHVWDPRAAKLVGGQGLQADHRIATCAVGGKEILVSTATGSRLHAWDAVNGLAVPPDDRISKPIAVAASPDGHWIAISNADPDSRLHLWDNRSKKMCAPAEGPRAQMTFLTFSPDSKTLASCCRGDGTAWLWDPETGEPKLIIPEAAEGCTVEAVAFHPNGRWLACGGIDWLATGGSDGAVSLWNIDDRERLLTVEGGALNLAFDPTGERLAVAAPESILRIIDVGSEQVVREIEGPGGDFTAVIFSPDNRWLVAGCDDHTVRVWDAQTYQSVAVQEFDTPIRALCFGADGKTLYTGNGNTTCYALVLDSLLTS
jgi:WD40 repeat protein